MLEEVPPIETRLKVPVDGARELGGTWELGGKIIVSRNMSPEDGAATQGGGVGHSGAERVAEGAGLVERFVLDVGTRLVE